MKKIKITESQYSRLIKEQTEDIPKDVKLAHDKYLMSPEIEDYIFEDTWDDAQTTWDEQDGTGEELLDMLAQGFTFMAGTMYAYGEDPDISDQELYVIEAEMSDKLKEYYDHEQIVRQVLENINHPEKEEVFKFIDKVKGVSKDTIKLSKRRRGTAKMSSDELSKHILDTYVSAIEDETNMDDFGDTYEYYDNVIGWAVEKYIEAEEPEKEDDWDYRDELDDNLKNYWSPI